MNCELQIRASADSALQCYDLRPLRFAGLRMDYGIGLPILGKETNAYRSESRRAPQMPALLAKHCHRLAKLDLRTGVHKDVLHCFRRQERRDGVRFVDFTPDLQEALKTRWFCFDRA